VRDGGEKEENLKGLGVDVSEGEKKEKKRWSFGSSMRRRKSEKGEEGVLQ
jgi:hypothetical protein